MWDDVGQRHHAAVGSDGERGEEVAARPSQHRKRLALARERELCVVQQQHETGVSPRALDKADRTQQTKKEDEEAGVTLTF